MTRNNLGQFTRGIIPHNKKWTSCSVFNCDRTDMKAKGLCQKHYSKLKNRIKNGQKVTNLHERLKRTDEHINKLKNSYPKTNSLKGRTYKEIYGDRCDDVIKRHSESLIGVTLGRPSKLKGIKTGRIPWNKGKRYFELDKNPAWKGGKSFEIYPKDFSNKLKNIIRDRDGRKCVECGCPEIELDYSLCIHHIDEDKKNNEMNNLISLCRKCHAKVHWSKKDWINYFKNIIKENNNVDSSVKLG